MTNDELKVFGEFLQRIWFKLSAWDKMDDPVGTFDVVRFFFSIAFCAVLVVSLIGVAVTGTHLNSPQYFHHRWLTALAIDLGAYPAIAAVILAAWIPNRVVLALRHKRPNDPSRARLAEIIAAKERALEVPRQLPPRDYDA